MSVMLDNVNLSGLRIGDFYALKVIIYRCRIGYIVRIKFVIRCCGNEILIICSGEFHTVYFIGDLDVFDILRRNSCVELAVCRSHMWECICSDIFKFDHLREYLFDADYQTIVNGGELKAIKFLNVASCIGCRAETVKRTSGYIV